MELQLESLVKLITDKVLLIDFLMQRNNAKSIIIQVLRDIIMQMPNSLPEIPAVFDKINVVYRSYLENEIQSQVKLLHSIPIQLHSLKFQLFF